MASEQKIHSNTYTAGAAVNRYRAVKGGAADKTVIQGAAGADVTIGVSEQAAAVGEPVSVQHVGVAKVECGAAVTRWVRLKSDGVGRGVDTTAASDGIIGIALEAGAGAGSIIEVFLTPVNVRP